MAGSHAPIDTRICSSMAGRLEQALGLTLAESDRLRAERERLREENRRLALEIARLSQENVALRESAEIWIRMYETTLLRANEATRALAARSQTPGAGRPLVAGEESTAHQDTVAPHLIHP